MLLSVQETCTSVGISLHFLSGGHFREPEVLGEPLDKKWNCCGFWVQGIRGILPETAKSSVSASPQPPFASSPLAILTTPSAFISWFPFPSFLAALPSYCRARRKGLFLLQPHHSLTLFTEAEMKKTPPCTKSVWLGEGKEVELYCKCQGLWKM